MYLLGYHKKEEAQYVSLMNISYEPNIDKKRVISIVNETSNCVLCKKESHSLSKCEKFKKQSVDERWETIRKIGGCFSCLKVGHRTTNCTVKRFCNTNNCKSYHNRFLHKENLRNQTINLEYVEEPIEEEEDENRIASISLTSRNAMTLKSHENKVGGSCTLDGRVFYKILPVKIYGIKSCVDALAFIDEGANITLIDYELTKSLGKLKENKRKTKMTIKWFGETTITENSDIVSLEISGINEDKRYMLEDVRTTKHLDLPHQFMDSSKFPDRYKQFREISLCYPSDKPKILIGLDNSYLCYSKNSFEKEGLIASKCRLGWTIFGKANEQKSEKSSHFHHANLAEVVSDEEEPSLHKIIEDFINSEDLGLTNNECISIENKQAIDILENTTRRIIGENRFETGLLWKSINFNLPDNFSSAYKRLLFIENKMKKDTTFAENYERNLMNYVEKGYARKLSKEEESMFSKQRSPFRNSKS